MAKRTLSLALGLALAAGGASVATAASASAAPQCTIPASDLTVTATDTTSSNSKVAAWDLFKVSYTLKNLDGLAAGSCITFSAPAAFEHMTNSTIDLKASDGSLIGTQTMVDGTVTITLTTAYAATHTNVSTWGWYTAQLNDTVATGSTVPLVFTVNGTVTTSQDVTTTTCVDCSAMPVGVAQKYGSEAAGRGEVYVHAPVSANAGTTVTLKDVLASSDQAVTGVPTAIGYTAKNAWGSPTNTVDLPVTVNADGTWTVTTSRPGEAVEFTLPMSFSGNGPWQDTAKVLVGGSEYSASTSVISYDAAGAGDGKTPPPPVVDKPVAPEGGDVVIVTPAPVATRTYTVQVDTYSWKGSSWFGRRIAAFDDDSRLRYREDAFLWQSAAAKRYTGYGHRFVSFTAPVNATKAQLVAAYNKVAPSTLRITTTAKLGAVRSSGRVVDVWVLGNGATASQAWGAKKNVDQLYLGRR